VSQWLRRGFGLAIGFTNNLQVVTTINYYSTAALHNVQSLHTNLFYLSAQVFTGLLTRELHQSHWITYSKYYTEIKPSNHTLNLQRPTANSSVLLVPIRSSSPMNFSYWEPTRRLYRTNSVTYIAEERTRIAGNTSRDHHPPRKRKTKRARISGVLEHVHVTIFVLLNS
jgi:hypothetical protein